MRHFPTQDTDLKRANYSIWNNDPFVTLSQCAYLAAGFEPKYGIPGFNCAPLPDDFLAFYQSVQRLKGQLPSETNHETEVLIQGKEVTYEAAYLVQRLKSRKIPVDPGYNPVISDRRKNLIANEAIIPNVIDDVSDKTEPEPEDELLEKIKSSKIYAPLIWIYKHHYKGKSSFASSKTIIREILAEYHIESNKNSNKIFLSKNDCELLNNFMRMIHDVKKQQ